MHERSERRFAYRVNADDRVVSVTSEWVSFAQENQASNLTAEAVCGQPLFDYVADRETRHLYQVILDKVRSTRCTLVVPFRCDGPCVRRFMELTISPAAEEQVQFEGRIVREEEREAVLLLDPSTRRSDEFVVVCGWCKRVRVGEDWSEVETAVNRLELFHAIELPRITHGLCAQCDERIRRELELQ